MVRAPHAAAFLVGVAFFFGAAFLVAAAFGADLGGAFCLLMRPVFVFLRIFGVSTTAGA